MGITRNRGDTFSNVANDIDATRVRTELEKAEAAAMQQLIGQAAAKNLITEAGTTFGVSLPKNLINEDVIDFRTAFAMTDNQSTPLPMNKEENILYVQATTTSAIAKLAITTSAIELYAKNSTNIWGYPVPMSIAAD